MNRVAFTLCSNNYLAKAQVAANTFLDSHSDYRVFIVVVDQREQAITYPSGERLNTILIETIFPDIEQLAGKYDIVELNTSVKAKVFLYLFGRFKSDWCIYLDPDLMICSRFLEVERLLESGVVNVIITPHSLSPIDDGKMPSEVHLCRYGIYNLGFLAVARTAESIRFLEWWHDRLMKYCFARPNDGLFTDQSWINYAPAYFDGVHILKNLGYNVANWNLYEREIQRINGAYFVAKKVPLRFFHFSHYKYKTPYLLSPHQNRHDAERMPNLKALIDDYQSRLMSFQQPFYDDFVSPFTRIYKGNRSSNQALHGSSSRPLTIRLLKAARRRLQSVYSSVRGEKA